MLCADLSFSIETVSAATETASDTVDTDTTVDIMNIGEVRIAEDSDFALLKVVLILMIYVIINLMYLPCRFSLQGVMGGPWSTALV